MQEVVCRSTPYAMLELTPEGKVPWGRVGTLHLKQPGQTQRGSLIKLGSEDSSGTTKLEADVPGHRS